MSAGRGAAPATSGTPRLTPALLLVAAVSLLAVVAAGAAGGWLLQPRRWFEGATLAGSQPSPFLVPPPEVPPQSQAGPVQRWIGAILLGLLLLALLAGVVYLARWLWRHRPRRAVVVEAKPATTPAGVIGVGANVSALLHGAEAAENILAESGVPHDLVLRCWLALEEAAAASGAARRPSDSPTQFTGAVLRSTAADRASVDTLLRLYHQARFSHHPITDDDVRAARTAVIKLAAIWRSFDTAMRHTARTDS